MQDLRLPNFDLTFAEAARKYSNPHSAGADSWTTFELKQLPEVALQRFGGIAEEVLMYFRWPVQCMANLMTNYM